MLNKRAARLLALLLTSSMVLMGPSAAMASTSAGDSKETSQTEQEEIDLGEDPNVEVDVDEGEDTDADEDPDEEKDTDADEDPDEEKDTDADEDPDEVKATEKAKEPEKDKKTEKKTKDKKEETEKEPACAKEGTTSGGDSVSGGNPQDDETGDRIISTNTASVNGTISGNIVISSNADGTHLTLNGVMAPGLRVEKVTGPVLIDLLGQNTVDEIVIEQGTQTREVSINGSGVLSSTSVNGRSLIIQGGNIQIKPDAFKPNKPVNVIDGDRFPLYPVKIAGSLAKNRLYKDLAIKTGSPLKAYPYNKEIRTSTNGELMMYLPSGKVQVTLDGHQYEGTVSTSGLITELTEASSTSTPSPAVPPQAQAARNGLYDIKDGSEYRSGVSINFYATGDRYDGPNASDEVGATRYVPVSWNASRVSSTSRASSSWSSYTKKVDGVYRFEGAYTPKLRQDESRLEYTLRVDYQKQMYDGSAWIPVTGKGAVASKTVDFYVSNASDEPDPASQQADPADNGIFWINPGATYRSGASLQFYATGDGYGPEEAQELNPLPTATRYIPTNWEVTTTNAANGSSDKGSWKKYTEETLGNDTSGNYVPGEYRFKDSFVLSTDQATSVPYTLKVTYKKQAYNGTRWTDDGTTSTKEVNFFIRNTAVTATPSYRPTTTPYYRSGVTTTASRSSVSSNARNARTMDDTPVGPLVLLMMAAAGSGAFIFRKKRNRS